MNRYSNKYTTENFEANHADFLEEVGKLSTYAKAYVNDRVEHTKIVVAEESVKAASGLVHAVVLAVLSLILIIFLSVVGGLALGRLLEDYVLGFLLVCAFYLLVLVIYLLLRKKLVNDPITKTIIQKILK